MKIEHYIKDKMSDIEKVNFAINILYDIKYEWVNKKCVEKAINELHKYYN